MHLPSIYLTKNIWSKYIYTSLKMYTQESKNLSNTVFQSNLLENNSDAILWINKNPYFYYYLKTIKYNVFNVAPWKSGIAEVKKFYCTFLKLYNCDNFLNLRNLFSSRS